jgi:hypothetical protein
VVIVPSLQSIIGLIAILFLVVIHSSWLAVGALGLIKDSGEERLIGLIVAIVESLTVAVLIAVGVYCW